MKNLRTLILIIVSTLFSGDIVSQENFQVTVQASRNHTILTHDQQTKDVLVEFYDWAYTADFDYESELYQLQEIRTIKLPKTITAKKLEGVIIINSRIKHWEWTYRKVIWMMMADHYGVKTYGNSRYNVLSEGIIWSDKANEIWKYKYEHANGFNYDIKPAIEGLKNKHPLKSKVQ